METLSSTVVLTEEAGKGEIVADSGWRNKIVWEYAIPFPYVHLAGMYGAYLATSARWETLVFTALAFVVTTLGVGAGAHRLWAHRSYKARRPLQVALMLMHSMSGQETVAKWVRNHRLHHKYSETDADPHNPRRGLMYSHAGWLLLRPHPECRRRRHLVDMSDIYGNTVLEFQRRNALWLIPLLTFVLPSLLPVCCWQESLTVAYHLNLLRFILNLNAALLINSAGHRLGCSRLLAAATLGEGAHALHHAFPQHCGGGADVHAVVIRLCEALGLAYDCKWAKSGRAKDWFGH